MITQTRLRISSLLVILSTLFVGNATVQGQDDCADAGFDGFGVDCRELYGTTESCFECVEANCAFYAAGDLQCQHECRINGFLWCVPC